MSKGREFNQATEPFIYNSSRFLSLFQMTQETTKDNILTVAVTVFAEKSYRQATVAEICKRAERKYPIRHLACHQPR